ncbi:MAG: hypothetical protein GX601_04770 [Anaerolineales bacterium]|nr:hypothetical protein [Anaerolineales bacterium]
MELLNIPGLSRCPLPDLVISDPRPGNLALAACYGATETVQAGTAAGDACMQELKEAPFDLVVEAAGVEGALQEAGDYVRVGRRLAIFA